MILFPPAKINLGLQVLFRRSDGYHELSTCMYPIPLFDVLELLPASSFVFHQTGIAIAGDSGDNLCVKAYELMRHRFNLPPVYMHLRKVIPMGAGLGGGSSDAAYVLKGLNEMFALGCSDAQLEVFAAELGSDCPFFIKNEAQIATGRGEVLAPSAVSLSDYFIKIVNPGIHVGTKEAYAGVVPETGRSALGSVLSQPISCWKDSLVNDFELSVFDRHPAIGEIKSALYEEGAVYAAMSGSGSTVFGIFEMEPEMSFMSQTSYLELIKKF
jgi:4-diphosphocytidyl-2-C-methyl-D-erythritol kinase